MRKKMMGGGMSNRMMYKDGKNVKGKYPSEGMNKLASKNPDVAKKIMGYKDGGATRKEFGKGGGADTHKTKDGRTAKKGLYYYMNRAKKRGTSKPGKGSVTDKALKASAKTAKKTTKKA
jgi:hypothetical protein